MIQNKLFFVKLNSCSTLEKEKPQTNMTFDQVMSGCKRLTTTVNMYVVCVYV